MMSKIGPKAREGKSATPGGPVFTKAYLSHGIKNSMTDSNALNDARNYVNSIPPRAGPAGRTVACLIRRRGACGRFQTLRNDLNICSESPRPLADGMHSTSVFSIRQSPRGVAALPVFTTRYRHGFHKCCKWQ